MSLVGSLSAYRSNLELPCKGDIQAVHALSDVIVRVCYHLSKSPDRGVVPTQARTSSRVPFPLKCSQPKRLCSSHEALKFRFEHQICINVARLIQGLSED